MMTLPMSHLMHPRTVLALLPPVLCPQVTGKMQLMHLHRETPPRVLNPQA